MEYRVSIEDIGVLDESLWGRVGLRRKRGGVEIAPFDALAFAAEKLDYEALFGR